jgi:hypothetical protein
MYVCVRGFVGCNVGLALVRLEHLLPHGSDAFLEGAQASLSAVRDDDNGRSLVGSALLLRPWWWSSLFPAAAAAAPARQIEAAVAYSLPVAAHRTRR